MSSTKSSSLEFDLSWTLIKIKVNNLQFWVRQKPITYKDISRFQSTVSTRQYATATLH